MTESDRLEDAIARTAGSPLRRSLPLSGGCIADVYQVELEDGRMLVAKMSTEGSDLALEGHMLRYLAEHSSLPVPEVLHAEDTLLMMPYIENSKGLTEKSQTHAAELVAGLHAVTADRYGFEEPTLIGGLIQPNSWHESWVEFFRSQRLLYMGRQAATADRLPAQVLRRLETFCSQLERWIEEPPQPCLLHGDIWSGNVLRNGSRIAAFIDPAIYYGDPEIELAFSVLSKTFTKPFFDRYNEIHPLRPGFFEKRQHIYSLYPLLCHARLFGGGGYVRSIEQILSRFGF